MEAFKSNIVFLSLVALASAAAVNYNGASIKEVTKDVFSLSEGPFWDSENNVLYFVDIDEYRVYRYVKSRLEYVQLNDTVGFVIPVAGKQGLFVIGLGTTLASLRWNLNESTHEVVNLVTVDNDKPTNRWNDGKADHDGKLWAGTLAYKGNKFTPNQGSLYTLNHTNCFKSLTRAVPDVSISNGLAWSKDSTKMYYIDSKTKQVALFNYNPITAAISNRRTFYNFKTDDLPGSPDGMTIDSNGDLWVANYGGAQVLHVSGSSGKLLGKLKIAAEKVSSVTFGGPNLDKLYVTTISVGIKKELFKQYPMTGKVLEVSGLGVTGTPNRRVNAKCFKQFK